MHVTASSPGKIILFGEHAVVYGKRAIAGAISLRTQVSIREHDKPALVVNLPDIKAKATFLLSQLEEKVLPSSVTDGFHPSPPSPHLLAALKDLVHPIEAVAPKGGVLCFLYLYFSLVHGRRSGMYVTITTDIPVSAGLGSSAAFSVASAAALAAFGGVWACGSSPCSKCVGADEELHCCDQQRRLINAWAYQTDCLIHGKSSGIDNTVATFGGVLVFEGEGGDGDDAYHHEHPAKFKRIFQSCSHEEKKHADLAAYVLNTQHVRDTSAMVQNVRQMSTDNSAIVTGIMDSIDAVSDRAVEIFKELMVSSTPADSLVDSLERLFDVNHSLLLALGVGHPRIDEAVRVARHFGMHPKITGGGGCVVALSNRNREQYDPSIIAEKLNGRPKRRRVMSSPSLHHCGDGCEDGCSHISSPILEILPPHPHIPQGRLGKLEREHSYNPTDDLEYECFRVDMGCDGCLLRVKK